MCTEKGLLIVSQRIFAGSVERVFGQLANQRLSHVERLKSN